MKTDNFEIFFNQVFSSKDYTKAELFNITAIISDFHRFSFPLLFQYKNITGITPNLIYFDRHPDLLESSDMKKHFSSCIGKDFTAVVDYVSNNFSLCNDDWVKTACYFDIVKDVHLIGGFKGGFVSDVKDFQGNSHKVFQYDDLSDFEYDFSANYVLDIDLDFFAYEESRIPFAWKEEQFKTFFIQYNEKLRLLFKNTPYVSIARETECCGGEVERKKIFFYLKNIQF